MDRRSFVGAFAWSLVIAPSVAEAQPAAKMYRIGFFLGATGESVASLFGALNAYMWFQNHDPASVLS
jgi:hypothetical protein